MDRLNQHLLGLAHRYTDCALELLRENLTSVVLFGSVARVEARDNSYIDLLVVARDLPRGAFNRQALLAPVRERLLPDLEALWEQRMYIDFGEVIKTQTAARHFHLLYLDLTEEAVLLYDRNGFFAGVLEAVRQRLTELGSRRRRLGQIAYWDLKPDLKPGEKLEL